MIGSPLDYQPEPFSDADLEQANVYTLRGARRAGKTVALKLLIEKRLSRGVPGRSISWTTADTIRRMDLLETHLVQLIETQRLMQASKTPIPPLLVVDEITSVRGWQKVIKKLRDTGVLDDYCVILTGSSAHDLKIGAERMAGRRGLSSNLDRILLPMDFPEFERQMSGAIRPDQMLTTYLKCGGYPFRVSEFKKSLLSGKIPDERIGMNVFEEVVFYEIERRKLERSIAMEVIERLSSIGASSASYDGFAKATSSTKETVRKHLGAFGDAFLLATYSSFDLARRRGAPRKERKFCWTDPALRYFVEHLGRGPAVDDAVVAEWLVGVELCRLHETRLHEGLSSLSHVYTWKSSAGKEIDFLVQDRSSGKPVCHPFEVKFQSSVSEWDWKVMLKSFGRGTLVIKHPLGGIAPPEGIRVVDLESFLRRSGSSSAAL